MYASSRMDAVSDSTELQALEVRNLWSWGRISKHLGEEAKAASYFEACHVLCKGFLPDSPITSRAVSIVKNGSSAGLVMEVAEPMQAEDGVSGNALKCSTQDYKLVDRIGLSISSRESTWAVIYLLQFHTLTCLPYLVAFSCIIDNRA